MSDNAEIGIAKLQAANAQAGGAAGLQKHHGGTIAYLDERVLIFILAIAMIGLLVLWATAKSPLLLYGSLIVVILLTLLWGYARIKGIERKRRERAQQASTWKSEESD
jgi:hypothetical protein